MTRSFPALSVVLHCANDCEPAAPVPAPSGLVLPFAPAARRRRRAPGPREARGEILLFLGVRYERCAS